MICIIDYGVGNSQAFLNIFSRLGIDAIRATNKDILKTATHLILPGVGNFDNAIQKLNESGMRETLEDMVLKLKIPLLGVCVGMQILADTSEEGKLPGLGWIPGKVRAFSKDPRSAILNLPHMGWNTLIFEKSDSLLSNLDEQLIQFYFLHSYYFEVKDKADILGTTNYGFDFNSIVSHNRIYGVQFHPEKSHKWGEQVLKNFSKI
jgi:glutamine amidotransferase